MEYSDIFDKPIEKCTKSEIIDRALELRKTSKVAKIKKHTAKPAKKKVAKKKKDATGDMLSDMIAKAEAVKLKKEKSKK